MFRPLLFLLIATLPLLAAPGARAEEPSLFGSYDRLCGYDIVYWPTRHMALSQVTPDGRKVIVLDPILQRASERARRIFLAAHECAHHRMGHSNAKGVARRLARAEEVTEQELAADCWAAETLARAGQWPVVELMAGQFYRDGRLSPGGGYPSGVRRALMIKHCGEIGRARQGKPRQIARNGAIVSIFD